MNDILFGDMDHGCHGIFLPVYGNILQKLNFCVKGKSKDSEREKYFVPALYCGMKALEEISCHSRRLNGLSAKINSKR